MVPQVLLFFPGQKATFFLETLDGYGARADSPTTPEITRVFAFTSGDGYTLYDGYLSSDGYQNPTTKIDTGLYFVKLTLPKGASSVGSYLVDISYTDPESLLPVTQTYQVIVSAPFGNYTASVTI